MPNTVQVDFIGNPGQLFATADQVEARLNRLAGVNPGAAVDKLTNSIKIAAPQVTNFGNATQTALNKATVATDNLTAAEKRRAEAARQFDLQPPTITDRSARDVPIAGAGLPGTEPQQISDAQFRRGRQLADAAALVDQDKRERAAAFERSTQRLAIYRAEKEAEVGLEEKAVGRIKIVRGFGALFRASGLTAFGVNESEINAGIQLLNKYRANADAAANSTEKIGIAATATQSAFSSIASIGAAGIVTSLASVAAGALIVYHITRDIRDTEAQKLKFIEDGVKAYNAQIIAQKESVELAKRAREEAQTQRDLTTSLETKDLDSLLRRRKALEDEQRLNPGGLDLSKLNKDDPFVRSLQAINDRAAERQKALLALDAKIDALQKETSPAAVDKDRSQFESQLFQERIKNQEEDAKRREKAAEDRKRLAEKEQKEEEERQKKRLELVKTFTDDIENLVARANSDNPFVKIFAEGDKALFDLRSNLAGLKPELISIAEGIQKFITERQLFAARLDNKIEAINLEAQADRFRSPTPRKIQEDFNERLAEFHRTSNSTNPDVIVGLILEGVKKGVISKLDAFREAAKANLLANPDAAFQFREQLKATFTDEQVKNQRILDSKLDVASRAKTPEEQAIADQRIISFAGGLNPDDLTRSERSRVAQAFENRAIASEKREIEALDVQRKSQAILKTINDGITNLNSFAKNGALGGKAGNLDIRLKDDTSDKKATAATATPDDVAKTYTLDFVGGTNR